MQRRKSDKKANTRQCQKVIATQRTHTHTHTSLHSPCGSCLDILTLSTTPTTIVSQPHCLAPATRSTTHRRSVGSPSRKPGRSPADPQCAAPVPCPLVSLHLSPRSPHRTPPPSRRPRRPLSAASRAPLNACGTFHSKPMFQELE